MQNTGIEWTDNTYNPIRLKGGGFYCAKVSEACTNCYAEIMARRVAAMLGVKFEPYTNRKEFPEMDLMRGMLEGWAKKQKAKKNFVSSMTDVFGEFVPDEWCFEILDAMKAAPRQIFQVLTKRYVRTPQVIAKWLELRGLNMVPANIWIGYTICNQKEADLYITHLLTIPVRIRFLSIEPMLSAIDLSRYIQLCDNNTGGEFYEEHGWSYNEWSGGFEGPGANDSGYDPASGIQWVIVGGESGNTKGVRTMEADWVRSIRDQCQLAEIPFFFKQWGEYLPHSQTPFDESGAHTSLILGKSAIIIDGQPYWKVGKHSSGSTIDDETYKEFPNTEEYE